MNAPKAGKFTGWGIASLLALLLDVLGIIVIAAVTWKTKTAFTAMFKDLGVALPLLTSSFVSIPTAVYGLFFMAFS